MLDSWEGVAGAIPFIKSYTQMAMEAGEGHASPAVASFEKIRSFKKQARGRDLLPLLLSNATTVDIDGSLWERR
jgi:hypothetical protein